MKQKKAILLLGVLVLGVPLTIFSLLKVQELRGHAQEYDRIEAEDAVASGNATTLTDASASQGSYVKLRKSSQVTGKSYFIDCTSGNDNNVGTSQSTAWKTFSKIGSLTLSPGDGILLKRSSVCTNALTVPWNGTTEKTITIASYGEGSPPLIRSNVNNERLVNITGSYITLDGIAVEGVAPTLEAGCNNNPKGYIIGFQLDDSSHHITITNSKATGTYAGVYVKSGSRFNSIRSNEFTNNTMMSPLDQGGGGDAGAFGVLLHGSDNDVSYNTISGQDACSYDYGRDGSAVEIYGGSRNSIHHNIASQNDHFTELGKNSTQSSSDNTFAYNIFTSTLTDSVFLNTRGSGSSYGPIYRTSAFNNSVYLTGSQSQGVVCSGCGVDILTLSNNILVANWKSIYASASFDESNNIYWKPGGSPLIQGFTPSSSSKTVDPLYVNPGSQDLHTQASSPARQGGSTKGVTAGYTVDLDGTAVPQGSAVDIGAYEN